MLPTTDHGPRPDRGSARRRPAAAVPALALAATLALAGHADAQETPDCSFRSPASELADRASPPDSSTLELGDGMVKVCYGSPRVRGREIFGGLVPYGQPWRLGANEPTTLHTTVPLSVGGVEVEPGSYSLYAVPGMEEWEIVVNGATDRWGIPINDAVMQEDVGTLTAEAMSAAESVESLRITLASSGEGEARMAIAWAMTRVEVPLRPADGGMEGEGY